MKRGHLIKEEISVYFRMVLGRGVAGKERDCYETRCADPPDIFANQGTTKSLRFRAEAAPTLGIDPFVKSNGERVGCRPIEEQPMSCPSCGTVVVVREIGNSPWGFLRERRCGHQNEKPAQEHAVGCGSSSLQSAARLDFSTCLLVFPLFSNNSPICGAS
jgi:hypothetical protein